MKKIALLILANVLLFSGFTLASEMQSKTDYSPLSVTAPVGVWVKLTIIFHRPKRDCLKGFGLCFNIEWGIDGAGSPNEVKGCPVNMKIENNQLIMQVKESDLQNYEQGSTLTYFKDKTSMTLEDLTELPPGITRELGSSTPIVIKPGTYPVTYQNGIYTVVFQL